MLLAVPEETAIRVSAVVVAVVAAVSEKAELEAKVHPTSPIETERTVLDSVPAAAVALAEVAP